MQSYDINEIDRKIRAMKQMALDLKNMGEGFPCLEKNITRILAGLKMLEINISDICMSDEE